jgi:hypothetical protein
MSSASWRRRAPRPSILEAMYQAWVKAVILQVILWTHPYVKSGDF